MSVTTSKRKFEHIFVNVALSVLILLSFLCFFSAIWYVSVYGRVGFDSILYTLTADLGGVQSGLVLGYLLKGALPGVLCGGGVCFFLFYPRKKRLVLKRWLSITVSLVLSVGLLVHAAFHTELVDYILANINKSAIFETEYRNPNTVNLTFPEEKRNLVYIFMESMETSYLDDSMGGGLESNLIPELTQLAQENINFSHNETVGGFREVPGSGWTIGAMVAQTAGIPLKVPPTAADGNSYGGDGVFLPGVTNLTNILHENGYYQALMVGSDVNFGGRGAYYRSHGVDKIYDLFTARQDGIVDEDYFVWWGMEDMYLYEYAKQELAEIAAQEQPFAFTMLTVDTHHVGGYKCSLCGADHAENYDNVISCASKQVAQFVAWIQQQPFYENTTIIITGDHRSMDGDYFARNVDGGYVRHMYNCFINAAAQPSNATNREFTTVDMFPTTLRAIGCQIDRDRLGLGTDLFSDTPTLAEEMGYTAFCNEVKKDSAYYTNHFFQKNEK